jgi:hypothetical protein
LPSIEKPIPFLRRGRPEKDRSARRLFSLSPGLPQSFRQAFPLGYTIRPPASSRFAGRNHFFAGGRPQKIFSKKYLQMVALTEKICYIYKNAPGLAARPPASGKRDPKKAPVPGKQPDAGSLCLPNNYL